MPRLLVNAFNGATGAVVLQADDIEHWSALNARFHAALVAGAGSRVVGDAIARHDATLADPDLYARDPKAFDRAMTAAAKARSDLESAELEWLELEEKRENLAV